MLLQLTNLRLVPGTRYYATVTASNAVGLASTIASDGVVADNRPPTAGRVWDGVATGAQSHDLDCDVYGAPLAANWYGFASELGIDHYEWAVGTSPGASDVLPFTPVGLAVQATNATVLPPPAVVLYASVKAVNKVGLSVTETSDGILYLCPEPGSYDLSQLPAAAITACSAQSTGSLSALQLSRERGFLCVSAPADGLAAVTVSSAGEATMLQSASHVTWM